MPSTFLEQVLLLVLKIVLMFLATNGIEVLQNCLSFEKSFGCVYMETAFKHVQIV